MGKNNKLEKKAIKHEEKAIKEILNKWDIISSAPSDEYDCLIHYIIDALHKKAVLRDIKALLKREFIDHFGIEVINAEIDKYSEVIWDWWVEYYIFTKQEPVSFCCERFKENYKDGSIIHAYENSENRIDETEWIAGELFHIYYCPFCGAFIKGYGWGYYDREYPPNQE